MQKVSAGPITLLILISIILFCYAQHHEAEVKSSLIEDIVEKVCNLSISSFSETSPEAKTKLLAKIEEKLIKSAQSVGSPNDKYVKLIMKGLKIKVFGKDDNEASDSEENKSTDESNDVKINDDFEMSTKSDSSKQGIILRQGIYADDVNNKPANKAPKSKNEFLNDIAKGDNYVNLITKGITLMVESDNTASNNSRRVEFLFNNNITVNNGSHIDSTKYLKSTKEISPNNTNELKVDTNEEVNKHKSVFLNINKYKDYKSKSICDDVVKDICHKVKLLNTIKCQNDKKEILILSLCDGKNDCSDFSDEMDCVRQGMDIIESSSRLMSNIDASVSRSCFSVLIGNDVILEQNGLLDNVLKKQLKFLQTHSVEGMARYSRRFFNPDTTQIKKSVNEVAAVVNSLSSALELSLCSKAIKDKSRKQGNDVLFRNTTVTLDKADNNWPPASCKCSGQFCIEPCLPKCQQICWEQYSLSQWQCQAINGEKTVSLDVICDGKLDCYDETDESRCSQDVNLDKFATTEMYNYVLKMIFTKSSLKEFAPVRNKLLVLHAMVAKLQKLSLKRYADFHEVKRIREACFTELASIYGSVLMSFSGPEAVINIYVFLLSINEKLVSALKRSHTGNDEIISSNGCVCRGDQCALSRCSKSCVRVCKAEPKLTKYICSGSTSIDDSLPIEAVCNGKTDCPEGDDEENCKNEVCRSHHIMVLRLNLRDAGAAHKGTALGEALISWKTKVTVTLRIAETSNRPTPAMIRDIVHDILHDLVIVYATINDFRRSNTSPVFSEFYKWSQVVMDTLRACGK